MSAFGTNTATSDASLGGAAPGAGANAGNQDMLDKGVAAGTKHFGHATDASTTEKISDGIRSGFKKMTGKDVPIQDKQ